MLLGVWTIKAFGPLRRAPACAAATLSCPGECICLPILLLMTESAARAGKGTGLQKEPLLLSRAGVPLQQFAYMQLKWQPL